MLYSELINRTVINPVDKEKSKLVEIVAKDKGKYWETWDVMIESGMIHKEGKYFSIESLSGVQSNEDIVLGVSTTEGADSPQRGGDIYLSELNKGKVVTHKGEEIGKVYDFEIYVASEPWKVWKVFSNPLGLSPMKRRQRIAIKDIEEVRPNKLKLKESWKGD